MTEIEKIRETHRNNVESIINEGKSLQESVVSNNQLKITILSGYKVIYPEYRKEITEAITYINENIKNFKKTNEIYTKTLNLISLVK